MKWLAESFQFALFKTDPHVAEVLTLWNNIIASPPSSFQNNPPGAPPGGRASGIFDQYSVNLTAQPGRVDLFAGPYTLNHAPFATFSSGSDALKKIAGLGHSLLSKVTVNRIGVIASLQASMEKGKTPAEHFQEATGIQVGTDDLDLIFSRNVRRGGPNGQLINRIDRYDTTERQVIEVQSYPGTAVQRVAATQRGVFRQIDLNTVPDGRDLPTADAISIFDALVTELTSELER